MQTIFDALREDHDKLRTLMDIISKTQGASDGRKELFERFKSELQAHSEAEERAFYAVLMGNRRSQEKAAHSVVEHKEIDDLLETLSNMAQDNPHWIRRFATLKELVEHHADEEEKEVFAVAGQVLSRAEKKDMATRFEQEKRHEEAA